MTDDPRLTSDVSDFDFDKSAADSWRRFSERLAEVLSVMDPGATLSIGALADRPGERPPHVRFVCGENGALTAEASLAGLDADAQSRLEAAGWRPGAGGWVLTATQETSQMLSDAASEALRDVHGVQHPALLAPDELADILIPTPVEAGVRPSAALALTDAIGAGTRSELDAAVERELTSFLGHAPLRDNQGDLALRVGSTMVFVRPSADAQEVVVFAPLVHDVDGRSRAMEVLSDLNAEARWVRFFLIRDRVYVTMSVMADPLIPSHLQRTLGIVSLISDNIDNVLAEKLRGRVTFCDGDERGASGAQR